MSFSVKFLLIVEIGNICFEFEESGYIQSISGLDLEQSYKSNLVLKGQELTLYYLKVSFLEDNFKA